MEEGSQQMRVVNFERKFDQDVLVSEATLLDASCCQLSHA